MQRELADLLNAERFRTRSRGNAQLLKHRFGIAEQRFQGRAEHFATPACDVTALGQVSRVLFGQRRSLAGLKADNGRCNFGWRRKRLRSERQGYVAATAPL